MKSKTILIVSAVLILFVSALAIYGGTKWIFKQANAVSDISSRATSSEAEVQVSRPLPFDPAEDEVLETMEDLKKEEIRSQIKEHEPERWKEVAETKIIKVNGQTYTTYFRELQIKSDFCYGRDVYYYSTDDENANLYYDRLTGELLYARFKTDVKPEYEISNEEAKKIADDFLKAYCKDFALYTFDSAHRRSLKFKSPITATSNTAKGEFLVLYSRYINGYRTLQTIEIMVMPDGKIRSVRHDRFRYEGYNLNVKIDENKALKELEEKIKQQFEKPVNYKVKGKVIDICYEDQANKCLAIRFDVEVALQENFNPRYTFDIPIE